MKWRVQQEPDKCYLCEATDQPLDMHHVYSGVRRKTSEQWGLTVYLCHDRCHIFGADAVHMNRETDLYLKDKVQRIAMEHYNWTLEDWRKLFGKNYLYPNYFYPDDVKVKNVKKFEREVKENETE